MVVNSDATPAKRYFFYSPEMNLLSESALTTDPAPTILYDYVWFNGHPVGQINGGTQWTFTDHLGTPLIQTNATGDVFWQAEHEPYGRVFTLRTGPQHQPLRLPGQESEELNLSTDGNGASERFYNIFPWYRYRWGRYTQSDPIDVKGGLNLYRYANDNPETGTDRLGLLVWKCCGPSHSPIPIFRRIPHCWLKSDRYESGQGPLGGEGGREYPFCPTQVVASPGRFMEAGTNCTPEEGLGTALRCCICQFRDACSC